MGDDESFKRKDDKIRLAQTASYRRKKVVDRTKGLEKISELKDDSMVETDVLVEENAKGESVVLVEETAMGSVDKSKEIVVLVEGTAKGSREIAEEVSQNNQIEDVAQFVGVEEPACVGEPVKVVEKPGVGNANDEESESERTGSEGEDDDDERSDESNEDEEENDGGGKEAGIEKQVEGENQSDEVPDEVKIDFSKSKLYRSFKCHVASLLLRKKDIQDRGILSSKQRTTKLMEWNLEKEHASVIKLVKGSPLYCLCKCLYKSCDKVLISGFVERWHAETNTFHMGFGEIGPTLDDVHQIVGLPIKGKGLTGLESLVDVGEGVDVFIRRVLGIPLNKVREEFKMRNNDSNMRLEFLRKNLAENALGRCTAEQVARGYLFYLLGCTLFQDKFGDKVDLKYLYCLEKWNEIEQWAWGAAGLAHLYRELGKASRLGTKTISGYLTFLQVWIYEHFPTLRPHKSKPLEKGMPRTQQWTPSSHYNAKHANRLLKSLRVDLDGLTKADVVWTPYREVGESPDDVVWFIGALMNDEIIEPYQPDRLVRQFGHVQDIPRDPLAPKRVRKSGTKAINYTPQFSGRTDEFNRWGDHVMNKNNRGPLMKTRGECTMQYARWVKENLICRLDFSVKDPIAVEVVDEKKFEAWKILDSVSSKSTKQEILAAHNKAKEVLKEEMYETHEMDEGTSKKDTSAARKRKRR